MRLREDAQLNRTKALPNGAASTSTDVIDLEITSRADFLSGPDFELVAPVVTTGQLADAQTLIYRVETDDNSSMSSPMVLYPNFLTQTGAGGAGAATQTKRFALPSNTERYVRVICTKSGAGDASAASFTLKPKF